MSRSLRSRELRFIVKGDSWVTGSHGWQVKCCRCSNIKLIVSSHGKILPPEAIIKKLINMGWYIGNNPRDDLCRDCQRKPVESHIASAKKALSGLVAPIIPINGERVHFAELIAAAKTLEPHQAKELIEVLRERLPKKQVKIKPPKPLPESDSEYQRWLGEQE